MMVIYPPPNVEIGYFCYFSYIIPGQYYKTLLGYVVRMLKNLA